MERSGILPTTQFAYRKVLGTCDALLCVSHTLQSASESAAGRIVQIHFSAAFDRVNHLGILYKPALWVLEVLSCLYIDTVSIKPITACYGGWLEYTG